MRAASVAVVLLGLGVLSLALFPAASLTADAVMALAWGAELGRGEIPDVTAPLMPIQHPLPTAVGAVLSPLGPGGMIDGYRVLATLSLIALAYSCFRLAGRLEGLAAGALAVGLLLSRPQIIQYAESATIDIPFTALVLLAAALALDDPVENRWRALALLAAAGLLRPEAWVLSGAYGAWLVLRARARPVPAIVALVLCAPALWAGFDLLLTGDPLSTSANARADYDDELVAAGYPAPAGDGDDRFESLPGQGFVEPLVPGLPDLLGWPLAIAAVTAGVFALRRRATPGAGGGDRASPSPVAALALLVLAAVIALKALGFPYSSRFVVLPAVALVAVAAAAAVRLAGSPHGRIVLGVAAAAIAIGLPRDLEQIDQSHQGARAAVAQLDDALALARQPPIEAASECGQLGAGGEVNVINGVGVLAMELRRDPAEIPIRRSALPPPASVLVLSPDAAELDELERRPGPLLARGDWLFAPSCRWTG